MGIGRASLYVCLHLGSLEAESDAKIQVQIVYLEVALRQEFNCKLFLWEMPFGQWGSKTGKGKSRERVLQQESSHCGHLGLSPSGDLWERAENLLSLVRAACQGHYFSGMSCLLQG